MVRMPIFATELVILISQAAVAGDLLGAERSSSNASYIPRHLFPEISSVNEITIGKVCSQCTF